MKKLLAVILSLVLIFSLCSCKKTDEEPQNNSNEISGVNKSTVNLAYNAADTFNPYTAKTNLNKKLCSLLFDSLITINSKFEPINVLAATVEQNANTCVVTLKTAYFSDGSQLTANDVIYSFNLAKNSSEVFAKTLSAIQNAEARDLTSVIFTFSKIDQYAVNLLTFPIIKTGTDQLKNEDNLYLTPVGCGRYVLNDEHNGLVSNKSWHGGNVNIEKINFINTPDNEALTHSVEIGVIDYYYTDLSDCNIIRMSGERVNIPLNNLVYIGLNMKTGLFTSAYARQAVSSGIDRNIICEEGYYNNAVCATGIFYPGWEAVSGSQTIQNSANVKIAIENLGEIGYNKKDNEGYFLNSRGNRLTISLLVNKENTFRLNAANLIASQLAAVGIKVNVKAVDYSQYKNLLKAGSFDMYIAETFIPYNMDVSPLVTPSGELAFGLNKSQTNKLENAPDEENKSEEESGEYESQEKEPSENFALENVIAAYYSGNGNIPDIAVTANSEMPIIPVCYRTGVLFCSNKISVNTNVSADDVFLGFENITIN